MGLSLAVLSAAGTGAGAAETPKVELTNYTAHSASQSLRLSLQLPTAVNNVLKQLQLIKEDPKNNLFGIDERISYSSALGQWIGSSKSIKGEAESQVFYGTLNPLISKVLGVDESALGSDKVTVTSVNAAKDPAARTIKSVDLAGLVQLKVGTQDVSTKSALTSAVSNGFAELLGVDVSLAPLLGNANLKADLGTLTEQIDGALDTINNTLTGVLGNSGIKAEGIEIPSVGDLTNAKILHVGVMDAKSTTGVQKLAKALSNGATEFRTAHAMNKLGEIDILNGLVHIDAITLTADARLDNRAGNAAATPVTEILNVQVGKNKLLNLTTGKITVGGQSIDMPESLKNLANNLVLKVAGVDVEVLRNVRDVRPGHAFAQANSLKISVAPAIQDPTAETGVTRPLFALSLQGPMSEASVDVNTTQVLGFNTRTGLNDTMFVIVGPLLFAAAVLVRRFALSR
jgi:hypothetical protein